MLSLNKEKLLEDVRSHGVKLNTIDDLKYMNSEYHDLVPIILSNIEQIDDEGDKEFLIRCLGVKGFYEATPTLIREFYSTNNSLYKWAIGNSLALISDKNALDDMLRMVCEKQHGTARQMIVDGLGAFKDPRVIPVLLELLKDGDVVGHAISALSKTGDPSLVKELEPFTNYKVTWIRKEAAKAIKKLSKMK